MKWFGEAAVLCAYMAGLLFGFGFGKDWKGKQLWWLLVPATSAPICVLLLALSRS